MIVRKWIVKKWCLLLVQKFFFFNLTNFLYKKDDMINNIRFYKKTALSNVYASEENF